MEISHRKVIISVLGIGSLSNTFTNLKMYLRHSLYNTVSIRASQVVLVVKNPPANAGDIRYVGSIPGLERFPWRRVWKPTPVFLLGESHGQRSLVGYSL